MDWATKASCFNHVMVKKRTDYWNMKVVGNNVEHIIAAKNFCWSCPVKTECLDHALTTPEPKGIWGGFTEKERRQLGRSMDPDAPRIA